MKLVNWPNLQRLHVRDPQSQGATPRDELRGLLAGNIFERTVQQPVIKIETTDRVMNAVKLAAEDRDVASSELIAGIVRGWLKERNYLPAKTLNTEKDAA